MAAFWPPAEIETTLKWLRDELPRAPGLAEMVMNSAMALPFDQVQREGGPKACTLRILEQEAPGALSARRERQAPLAEQQGRPPAPPILTQEEREEAERALRAGEVVQVLPGAPSIALKSARPDLLQSEALKSLIDLESDQPHEHASHQEPQESQAEASEIWPKRIRGEARACLRASRSAESLESILSYATYVAGQLTALQDWPLPGSTKERKLLIPMLKRAQPILKRTLPFARPKIAMVYHRKMGTVFEVPTFWELLEELIGVLSTPAAPIPRGAPRNDKAIFARKVLAWVGRNIADKYLDERQLEPLELWSVAVLVDVEKIPRVNPSKTPEGERARWEEYLGDRRAEWQTIYKRNLPTPPKTRRT